MSYISLFLAILLLCAFVMGDSTFDFDIFGSKITKHLNPYKLPHLISATHIYKFILLLVGIKIKKLLFLISKLLLASLLSKLYHGFKGHKKCPFKAVIGDIEYDHYHRSSSSGKLDYFNDLLESSLDTLKVINNSEDRNKTKEVKSKIGTS